MRISIIIPTRNRSASLQRAIQSISEQDFSQLFEVIVNDQSDHKTPPQSPKIGTFHYLEDSKNGISCGKNNAIRHAQGEYLMFIDDDSTLPADCLTKLHALLDHYPQCACLCGLILTLEQNQPFSRHSYTNSHGVVIDRTNFDSCLSAAMVVKRQAILDVGLFDESLGVGKYFGGSEESDLILRLLDKGYEVLYDSDFVTRHPQTDPSNVTTGAWLSKHYHYGLGRGAMLRKRFDSQPIWALNQLGFSFFSAVGAGVVSLLLLSLKQAGRYFASSWGRLVGFAQFYQASRQNEK